MSPGPAEEVGQTAREVVKGVAANPSCLAAITLAAIFAVLTYIAMQREAERQNQRAIHLTELLNKCLVVPEHQ